MQRSVSSIWSIWCGEKTSNGQDLVYLISQHSPKRPDRQNRQGSYSLIAIKSSPTTIFPPNDSPACSRTLYRSVIG